MKRWKKNNKKKHLNELFRDIEVIWPESQTPEALAKARSTRWRSKSLKWEVPREGQEKVCGSGLTWESQWASDSWEAHGFLMSFWNENEHFILTCCDTFKASSISPRKNLAFLLTTPKIPTCYLEMGLIYTLIILIWSLSYWQRWDETNLYCLFISCLFPDSLH